LAWARDAAASGKDDALSICFLTAGAAWDQQMNIVGAPRLHLRLACEPKPQGQIAWRLNHIHRRRVGADYFTAC